MQKLIFVVFLVLMPAIDADAQLSDAIRIETGLISGYGAADAELRVFRGIPYAAPPVGALRWHAPHPADAWSGVRPADAFGPTCMQDPPPPGSFYQVEFFEDLEPMSEDCLYLNLWTAASSADERRPVMMWIHGGAFRQGSGSMPSFDGTTLAEKGVVLVTINYRLGVFGLMAHPDLTEETLHSASGNYGLLDQIAALQWIRRNISAFGGDPSNVTVFGQSSGAASVNQLMASPLADGLFHKAVLQSGSAFAFDESPSLEAAEQTGFEFAASLGASSIYALRALPADTIHARGRGIGFSPNVDGYVLEDPVRMVFREGRQAAVPVLAGSTSDEGTPMFGPGLTADVYREMSVRNYGDDVEKYLSLYPADSDEQAGRSFSDAFSDRLAWGAHTLARLHDRDDVFLYLFSRIPPGRDPDRYRAYHSAELVYVFDALEGVDRPWTPVDRQIADRMSSYWATFAATGNPNGTGSSEWPVYDPATRIGMEIGDEIRPVVLLDREVIDFYDERAQR
ncbi:MAG: carboxylesterase family protein [Rhodothermales bacterium]